MRGARFNKYNKGSQMTYGEQKNNEATPQNENAKSVNDEDGSLEKKSPEPIKSAKVKEVEQNQNEAKESQKED